MKQYPQKERLFFDIEVSPNVVLSWRTGYELSISPDNILEERAIICICWKWEGEKKIHSLEWDKKQCDKKMLEKFIPILNSATEAIGHNGDRFDLKWIKGRCLFHRIPTYPRYTTIDTLKIARANFNLNSNKLDYIAQFLGFGGKMETGGFGLWKSIVLDKCEKSLSKMVRYCKKDVALLERVFQELRSYAPHTTHYGVKDGLEAHTCPNCTSTKTGLQKTRTSATGAIKRQMQCKRCGTYFSISNRAYENHKELAS